MNKKYIIILVLVLLGVGFYFSFYRNTQKDVSEETGVEAQSKIDINAVCEGALAYMLFPDGASADAFVKECKEGKHPQVIEDYKKQMNLGDGANI